MKSHALHTCFFVFRHCIAKIQPPLFVVKVNKKVENLTYKVYFLSCYLYWILTFWHCSIDWLFMTFVNVQFISLFAISKYIQCLKSSGSKDATHSFKISYKMDPSMIKSIIQWFSKLCSLVKVGKKFNSKVAEGITSDHHDFNYDLSCLSCSAL